MTRGAISSVLFEHSFDRLDRRTLTIRVRLLKSSACDSISRFSVLINDISFVGATTSASNP